MDTVSKNKRSEIMSRVKSKNSKIEMYLGRELSKVKLRYRKHVSGLPGKPDIAFIGKKVVVFVDSCFWHGCRWHGSKPSTNKKFWCDKITRNKERDKEINNKYRQMGWKVLRFWEHQIKKDIVKIIVQIQKELSKV